eukprot:1181285-Prorocentrum_minimum.AAC.2
MASEPLLDTAHFTATLDLQAIRVSRDKCHQVMKMLKGKCLDRPRMKCVIVDPEDECYRLILLHESVQSSDGEGLPPDTLAKLKEENLTPFVSRHIKLEYEYFTAEQILK